jgi:hypothetical protein
MAYDRRAGESAAAQPPQAAFDYRPELGRVYVPVGIERDFVVLDPARAATLRAWSSLLIPARGARPSAGEIGATEYIDATVHAAPRLRAALLTAIDTVEQEAWRRERKAFAAADRQTQTRILRDFEASQQGETFAMIRELTYEAYYAHPRVLDVVEAETGWRYEEAFSGGVMEPFDEELLERMKTVPPRYRRVTR